MNPNAADISAKTYLSIIIAIIFIASLGKLLDFPDIPRSAIGFELSLALAAVLLFGARILPALFLGVLIAQILFTSPTFSAVGMSLLCLIAAMLGRWGMISFNDFDNNLENRKSVISLLIWGSGVAALFSTLSSLSLLDVLSPDFQVSLEIVVHTWMWTAMGILLIVPRVLLSGNYHYVKLQYDQRQVLWLIAIFASCLLVFTDLSISESLTSLFLPFIFYPLIVWGALYVGLSAVYAGAFLIFMSAYSSYFFGIGYYGEQLAGVAFEIWIFIMSLLITGLAVGVSQVQREEAEWRAASSRMDELLSRTSLSLKTLLMLQCKTAVNGAKGCYSGIFLINDSGKLMLDAQYNLPEKFIEATASTDFSQAETPIKQCYQHGRLVSSTENPRHWMHLDASMPLWGGVHCFPILDMFRKPLGVLCVFYASSTWFHLADMERLQRIAYQSSLLIVRKQAEIALNEKHREVENERAILRTIIDANPDIIFIEGRDHRLTHSNKAFDKLMGLDAGQSLNLSSEDIFSEKFTALIAEMNQKILNGEAPLLREEIWIRGINYTAVLFDLIKAPMQDIEGRIVGIISIGRDITQQREVEAELVGMTEDQQRSIGQDLHDGVGQKLVGISFLAKLLDHGLHAKQSEFARNASTLTSQINEVISEIRGLARGLLPIELESNGLNAALDSLTKNTTATCDVNCVYMPTGEVLISDRIVSLNLYRIAQEAISNAIRHGKANKIEVGLEVNDNHFTLTVRDNGIGFDYEKYQQFNKIKGIGLQSMIYRTRLINAKVSFAKLAEGFEVKVVR
ncbi:MAG: PAS domain S-box protein [Methylophaga sp.]|nr:PAS domain S-box protein [Methylophaga sp.]